MPFEQLTACVPQLGALPASKRSHIALPPTPLATFGDDIEVRDAARLSVRVVARGDASSLQLDFRDSAPAQAQLGFGLSADQVKLAAAIAVAHALELSGPDQKLVQSLHVECSSHSWIGGGVSHSPGHVLMAMARVFDTVLGALASAWPQRVGAGSCSLGALVELRSGPDVVTEILPGGEGAMPSRAGRHAWPSPIVEPRSAALRPAWLDIQQANYAGSGGGGARVGGEGVIRSYRVRTQVTAHVAIDRRSNPPHGIDRAGPPKPAFVELENSAAERGPLTTSVPAWETVQLPAGSRLVVATAGGAGHGFGGLRGHRVRRLGMVWLKDVVRALKLQVPKKLKRTSPASFGPGTPHRVLADIETCATCWLPAIALNGPAKLSPGIGPIGPKSIVIDSSWSVEPQVATHSAARSGTPVPDIDSAPTAQNEPLKLSSAIHARREEAVLRNAFRRLRASAR